MLINNIFELFILDINDRIQAQGLFNPRENKFLQINSKNLVLINLDFNFMI